MKCFVLSIALCCAGTVLSRNCQAFERSGHGCFPGRATLQWDGRCDPTGYLPPTFRDYAQPRQLGPNAFMYWRCPQCAEDQFGYYGPGFNFFTVPCTFDPSLGQDGCDEYCQPPVNGNYMSQRKLGTRQR